jgi:hypothetical protein
MLSKELFYVCLYIAGFGLSDIIVEKLKLKGMKLLFYYFIILAVGIVGLLS